MVAETKWYSLSPSQVEKKLNTNITKGLALSEIKKRQQLYGLNKLREKKTLTIYHRFINQFRDFLVIILIIASIISFAIGEITDCIVISCIIILNALLGVLQEHRASKALEALQQLATPKASVIRNSAIQKIPSKELVPGDIVILETGNYVPADLRLVESSNLKIDESSITGESIPITKDTSNIYNEDISFAEQRNCVFMGTIITHGKAKGIVIATGINTQMGLISQMLESVGEDETPLQRKLSEFGQKLGIACLITVAIIFALGILRGIPHIDMFMVSVSLAVAAIPEGLPAIVTIVLALGMQRMAKRNTIVKKLHAVETLGSTTVICSDKTGTLTQNEMTVTTIYSDRITYNIKGQGYMPYGDFFYDNNKKIETKPTSIPDLSYILKIGALCNDSVLVQYKDKKSWSIVGDPTEGALIVVARKAGLKIDELNSIYPRVREIPFDSDRKMMTTIHHDKASNKYFVFVKGAPDILLSFCNSILENGKVGSISKEKRETILKKNKEMADNALRVLGFAYKEIEFLPEKITSNEIEKNLVFSGLMGMIDPPRAETIKAIDICKKAGIRPVMITGDYKDTAIAIAKKLKITEGEIFAVSGRELDKMRDEDMPEEIRKISVFARVSPSHKFKIVEALKKNGEIVAMTGDGVNDAPALRNADIGIAMGITGTDVAKEASELILTDDNFASIVFAINEGRIIYNNIKKSINFLLSCNIAEILILLVAMLLKKPLPLLAVQILWVNLVTDALPALALGMEKAEKGIMDKPPRDPNKPILDNAMVRSIIVHSIIIMVVVLSLYLYFFYVTKDLILARTVAFTSLITSELFRVYTVRSTSIPILKIGVLSNPYLVMGTLFSFAMMLAAIYIPSFNVIFKTTPLGSTQFLSIIIFSLLPTIFLDIYKAQNYRS